MAKRPKKVPANFDFDRAVAKTRTALLLNQPFFGTLLMHLHPISTDQIHWAATDGIRLLLNPATMNSLSQPIWNGIFAHEVMHCALSHMTRRQERDPTRWGYAADVVINNMLDDCGLELPKGTIHRPDLNGLSTEQIYNRLADDKQFQQYATSMDPLANDLIEDAATSPGDANSAAEWKLRVSSAAQAARQAGKLPESLKRFAEEYIQPKVNWKTLLSDFVTPTIHGESTWTRQNRRFVSNGLYLPSSIPERPASIAVAVDTSGSIAHTELALFQSELRSLQAQFRFENVEVMYVDTQISSIEHFGPDDPITFKATGGGGTDFTPPFELLASRGDIPDAFIYFTDGWGSTDFKHPSYPVLWLVTTNRPPKADFGRVVFMEES